jgi:hypothetical protein
MGQNSSIDQDCEANENRVARELERIAEAVESGIPITGHRLRELAGQLR